MTPIEPSDFYVSESAVSESASERTGSGKPTPKPTANSADSADSAQPSDRQLFTLLCQDNLDALDALYSRHSKPVFGLALRILGSREEAADLTHEVFLRLWQRRNYDPQRGTMLVFLMMVTRSQALNRIRAAKSQRRLTERLGRGAVTEQSSLLDSISTEEMAVRVRQALTQLPDRQRDVLELAYYSGLSQSEITQRLDIPLGTVKSRSRQGLLKLRKLLKEWGD